MIRYLFLALALVFGLHTMGQSFDKDKMDAYFDHLDEHNRIMGSLSILHQGEVVYERALGIADKQSETDNTTNTRYRIGSISKSFTAAIILQMIQEGKLTLDTPLSDYFPQIANAAAIRIEHLLRHESGIFNVTNMEDYLQWKDDPTDRETMLNRMEAFVPVFEPGTTMSYSNSNYILLSYIAEEVDGQPFETIVDKRITKPLKLKDTSYGSAIDPSKGEARSFIRMKEWEQESETHMSVPGGAGGIVSTPEDINRFYYALHQGDILEDELLELMRTPKEGIGIGLFEFPFYERQAFGHTGGIDGFSAMAGYFPKEDVGIAFTSNGMVSTVNDVLIGVMSIYFGRDYEFPEFTESLVLSEDILQLYTGVYSSPSFPLKITITRQEQTLIGQATGQSSFALDAYEINKFKFEPAGLELEFKPAESLMILNQAGMTFELNKE